MANEIEYVIRARNEASKVLQDVRRDLVLLDEFGNVDSRLRANGGGASHAMTPVRHARHTRGPARQG